MVFSSFLVRPRHLRQTPVQTKLECEESRATGVGRRDDEGPIFFVCSSFSFLRTPVILLGSTELELGRANHQGVSGRVSTGLAGPSTWDVIEGCTGLGEVCRVESSRVVPYSKSVPVSFRPPLCRSCVGVVVERGE